MRVLALRHHAEDSIGLIGAAFEERGAVVESILFPDEGALPPPESFDVLVVLGAKWSVYDTATIGSWIGSELDWLRRADGEGVPTLGICFGAQALTAALGGVVEPAPKGEIGWTQVEPLAPNLVGRGPWFQFHFDHCLPPEDAEVLARNAVCVQAFRLRRNLGVQFHPEVDAGQFAAWLGNGCRELVLEAGLDPDALVAETAAMEDAARERARELVDLFLSQVASVPAAAR